MTAQNRLAWQCRRGMLELDILLGQFLEQRFAALTALQQQAFEDLLNYPDQILYDYLLGASRPANPALSHVIDQIRKPAAS